jgi:hypothetical protein
LLANASMPLKYWDEAFLTATFLINLLPSKVIDLQSPAERLLRITPNYDAQPTTFYRKHFASCANPSAIKTLGR